MEDFRWLIVNEKAKEVYASGLFELFIIYEESESLIESHEDLEFAMENGLDIGIEVPTYEQQKNNN